MCFVTLSACDRIETMPLLIAECKLYHSCVSIYLQTTDLSLLAPAVTSKSALQIFPSHLYRGYRTIDVTEDLHSSLVVLASVSWYLAAPHSHPANVKPHFFVLHQFTQANAPAQFRLFGSLSSCHSAIPRPLLVNTAGRT